jgi:hypothetical protein
MAEVGEEELQVGNPGRGAALAVPGVRYMIRYSIARD